MADFSLRVLTRQSTILATRASSVLLPGSEGDLEVLHNRAPMVCALRPGRIVVESDGTHKVIDVSGGFAIVTPGRVDVLLDQGEVKPV